jgi:hypothetical protein
LGVAEPPFWGCSLEWFHFCAWFVSKVSVVPIFSRQ